MKKLLFILFTFLMAHCIYSQGNNLQYNSVLVVFLEASGSNSSQVQQVVVPSNQILKITSLRANLEGAQTYAVYCNLDLKEASAANYSNIANGSTQANTPIWLPTGTYSLRLKMNTSGNGTAMASGVYFNIVN
tara:strand:- start:898 stop:1296 length:399 start_codon:yes stop_codon:yes gene_type:complete